MSDTLPDDPEETYTPDDEAGHAAVLEAYEEDKAERQEAWEDSLSKKERLQRARESRTFTIVLFGTEDVEFRRLTGDHIEWLEDLGEKFRGTGDEDELTDAQLAEYRKARTKTATVLGDRACNPEFDAAFWRDFEPELRQTILMKLRQRQSKDVSDQVSFRS